LAFDNSLPPAEAMGRIRDAFQDYDQGGVSEKMTKWNGVASTGCKPTPKTCWPGSFG
jgi:hypothetical protein